MPASPIGKTPKQEVDRAVERIERVFRADRSLVPRSQDQTGISSYRIAPSEFTSCRSRTLLVPLAEKFCCLCFHPPFGIWPAGIFIPPPSFSFLSEILCEFVTSIKSRAGDFPWGTLDYREFARGAGKLKDKSEEVEK